MAGGPPPPPPGTAAPATGSPPPPPPEETEPPETASGGLPPTAAEAQRQADTAAVWAAYTPTTPTTASGGVTPAPYTPSKASGGLPPQPQRPPGIPPQPQRPTPAITGGMPPRAAPPVVQVRFWTAGFHRIGDLVAFRNSREAQQLKMGSHSGLSLVVIIVLVCNLPVMY